MNIIDTTKAVIDTVKTAIDSTVVDTTAVDTIKNVVTETTIWQDKALMEVIIIVGGIILVLGGILLLDVLSYRKK